MVGEKLARARRVRSELGTFFEHARVPVIVVQPDGQFVTANDAAVAQYGWSLEELAYMRIHDLMAEPRPELGSDLERASRGDYAPLDRRLHRRKDGSVAWVVPRAGPVRVQGETLIVSVLQDVSALVDGLGPEGGTCVLVVADNRGGGIFSFLSQRASVDEARFEQLFGTPRPHDLVAVARAFGYEGVRVSSLSQLRNALGAALDQGGLTVIVADVPSRDENVRIHDSWNEKVKSILEGVR